MTVFSVNDGAFYLSESLPSDSGPEDSVFAVAYPIDPRSARYLSSVGKVLVCASHLARSLANNDQATIAGPHCLSSFAKLISAMCRNVPGRITE